MRNEAVAGMRTQAGANTTETEVKEQTADLVHLSRYTTEESPLPLVVVEGSAHIVQYANPAFCALCGKTREELIERPYAEVVQEGKENGSLALLDRVYRAGETETLTDQQHASYGDRPAYWSYTAWAMRDEQGHPSEVIVQVTDTTESAITRQGLSAINQALLLSDVRQHEIAATTEVKAQGLNLAMRETDHRVKNNLQMIGALLDMQITSHADTIPTENLVQLRMQILTLAAVHAMLVQNVEHAPAGDVLSAQELLHKLMPMLQQTVGKQDIIWTAEEVRLTSKQGSSLALMINELVSNAVKHGGDHVELRLAVAAENVTLEVLDDGPGFVEGFHPETAAHFGLEFVETLSRHDLGGQTAYENRLRGGACVRITFPLLSRSS